MTQNNGFFSAPIVLNKGHNNVAYHSIEAGGGVFYAAAISFIDLIKSGLRLNDRALNKVLAAFALHFPEDKLNHSQLNALEKMRLLIQNPHKSEFIHKLAYILRQIAVDELLDKPLEYRIYLTCLPVDSTEGQLRGQDTSHSIDVLAALSKAIDIDIIVSEQEPGKEFRRCMKYSAYSNNSAIPCQLRLEAHENGYCKALVKSNPNSFFVGQLALNTIKPVVTKKHESWPEVRTMLDRDNKELWGQYKHYVEKLSTMVASNEITSEMLNSLYLESPLDGGHAKLFTHLATGQGTEYVSPCGLEEAKNRLLIAAYAQSLSLNTLNAEEFFSSLDADERVQYRN